MAKKVKGPPEYHEYIVEAQQHLGHAEGHTEFLLPDVSKQIRQIRKAFETCTFRR